MRYSNGNDNLIYEFIYWRVIFLYQILNSFLADKIIY